MSSSRPGRRTSASEVTNIGVHGFWFLDGDSEYFVPFKDYPEFREATVAQIHALRKAGPGQYHWPGLDLDIEAAALEEPKKFPLAFRRSRARGRPKAAARAR